jgi:hypothetical protein
MSVTSDNRVLEIPFEFLQRALIHETVTCCSDENIVPRGQRMSSSPAGASVFARFTPVLL